MHDSDRYTYVNSKRIAKKEKWKGNKTRGTCLVTYIYLVYCLPRLARWFTWFGFIRRGRILIKHPKGTH